MELKWMELKQKARCAIWGAAFFAAFFTPGAIANSAPDYSDESLYSGPEPSPGPDILYAAPPRAPQLENADIWSARPIRTFRD